uniref:G-protein coupled receptors family 1 profile domain-containing protein n=1 Tax=Sus scrofa TaxID=9823 RepID=A0A8D1DL50_PIG
GLSYDQNIQIFCFIFFFFFRCLALLVGNLLILVSIQCSPLCSQPMYYFLSHLSFIDICYTSSVTPKLIGDLLVERKNISYAAWAVGAVHALPQFFTAIRLPFCGPNELNHYFCDIFPLLKIACTDIYINGILVIAFAGMTALLIFAVLSVSYGIILFSLKNHSAERRQKVLSTCGFHITVVILFFVPVIFIYFRAPTTFLEKIFALFYTIIAPMFNPLIYTLRNTEMKTTLKKLSIKYYFQRKHSISLKKLVG